MRALWVLLAVTALSGCNCLNECDFWSRCDGGVLETCGAGVDQQIGRKVRATPCVAPNAVCLEEGEEAACVMAPPTRCDAGAVRCEGALRVFCSSGPMSGSWLVGEDCAAPIALADGGTRVRACTTDAGPAQCVVQ